MMQWMALIKIIPKLPLLRKEAKEFLLAIKKADDNTKIGTIRKEWQDVLDVIEGILD